MGRKAKRRSKIPSRIIIRTGGHNGPHLADSGSRWTDAHEERFLDELAASCNVTRAAKAVGFSCVAIYRRRRTDAAFAERWQKALAQGYLRIEMALLRRADEAAEGRTPDPRIPIAPMTVKEALSLLKMHSASVTGQGFARGRRAQPRTLDEVRDSILAKLEAIEAARRARGEPGWPGAGAGDDA